MVDSISDHLWDSSGQITSTGSANAYVIGITEQLGGYYQGMPPIRFKANFANTGSATANIVTQNAPSGLGAVTLKKYGGASNLASGDIVSGGIYTLSHDGTNFQVLELQPTAAAVSGFPMTASGDRWGVLAPVGTDGVMEIGRYLDFHDSDGDTSDFQIRLETNGTNGDLHMTRAGGANLRRIPSLIASTLAQGDIFYYDGTNFVRLAPGTSGQFLQTQGAAANPQWASASQTWTTVTKATDETTASDTTLSNDAALLVPLLASTNYWMRGRIFYDTPAAADFKYAFAGPASPTLVNIGHAYNAPNAGLFVVLTDTAYGVSASPISGTNGFGWVEFEALIRNGANAGNFAFQWAQNTSNASNTTVRAGSYIEYRTV